MSALDKTGKAKKRLTRTGRNECPELWEVEN